MYRKDADPLLFKARGASLLLICLSALMLQGCRGKVVTVPPSDYAQFERHISSTYSGQIGEMLQGVTAENITPEQTRQLLERGKGVQEVKITSAIARRSGREYVVKVDFTLGGKPAPDGKTSRYFLAEKRLTGWRVVRETSSSRFDRFLGIF